MRSASSPEVGFNKSSHQKTKPPAHSPIITETEYTLTEPPFSALLHIKLSLTCQSCVAECCRIAIALRQTCEACEASPKHFSLESCSHPHSCLHQSGMHCCHFHWSRFRGTCEMLKLRRTRGCLLKPWVPEHGTLFDVPGETLHFGPEALLRRLRLRYCLTPSPQALLSALSAWLSRLHGSAEPGTAPTVMIPITGGHGGGGEPNKADLLPWWWGTPRRTLLAMDPNFQLERI